VQKLLTPAPKIKMKLELAEQLAEKIVNQLKPYCKRIEVAGSIRRKKPEIRDIEICLIPENSKLTELAKEVDKWQVVKGRITGKYTQRILSNGMKLDIFIAQMTNWGNIFLIRTGNWKFSKWIMGTKTRQAGYYQKDGYMWINSDTKLACYEEIDVFHHLNMKYIEPENREY